MRDPLKYPWHPEFQYSSLVVGWGSDAGKLGDAVTDYIIKKLNGQLFYEIEPDEYFLLGGVTIEDDLLSSRKANFLCVPNTT